MCIRDRWRGKASATISIGVQLIPVLGCAAIYLWNLIDELTAMIFLAVSLVVLTFTAILYVAQRRYLGSAAASSIGLMAGSAIIGVGLWAYSQLFILPIGGIRNAPLVAALVWFLWTYLTEIPFLHFLLPPILEAAFRAMPSRLGILREERVRE